MLQPIGGDKNKQFPNISNSSQGPEFQLPTEDLNNLFVDEDDEGASNIVKNLVCNYHEPEDVCKLVSCDAFSIFSHNIRSLSGHFDNLKDCLYSMLPATFSVIALQEVWSIHKQFDITGYSNIVYKTRDMDGVRNPNCGGGVGYFVNKDMSFEVLEEESIFVAGVYESLWIKVEVSKTCSKIIGNIYRPNSAPRANFKQAVEIHSSILSKISKNKNYSKCSIEICGDFNIDLLQFQHHEQTNDFLELSLSFGLLPVITKPTRITPNTSTLIDHIWVKDKSELHTSGVILSHISDHYPTFYVHNDHKVKQKAQPFKTRQMTKDAQLSFKKLLETADFSNVLSENDPKTAFDSFLSIYNTSAELAFPEVTVRPKKNTFAHSPWMTPGLLISSKTRQKLLRSKQSNPNNQNVTKFQKFNKIFTSCRRKAQALYYSEKFSRCKSDLKETWKVVREVSCTKPKQRDNLPDFFRHENRVLQDPKEIADNFNKFFADIGPNLADKVPKSSRSFSDYLGSKTNSDFQFSELSQVRLYNFIKKMKPKTSYGEDLVSSKVFQFVAPVILRPLRHLINLSLKTGYFPSQFKVAKVIPIHKESDRREFNNYRPISLLSSFSRLLESIVSFELTAFADAYNLFYKHQYGFRAKHSVSHSLLYFTQNILEAINNDKINISIFVDLKKAFDTVCHEILLAKLEHYGVRNVELQWFRNYLSSRTQYVHLNLKGGSFNSCLLQCKCGVPQGSCLGPLLFLFFINDLPNATQFFSSLFADDTTFQITGSNTSDTFLRANIELKKAEQWFNSNKLTLNAKKTRVMVFKNKKQHVHYHDLFLQNSIIERAGDDCKENLIRFLGIWIDENLSFTGHLAKLKSKLNSGLYALASCSKIVPFKIRKLIYHSLLESHLHFGSIIYGATHHKNLGQIEAVQRKAIRVLTRSRYDEHSDPLFRKHEILKLGDLIQLNQTLFVRQYKNGKLPDSFTGFFQDVPLNEQKSRDDDYNLKQNQINNNTLLYFPSSQIIRSWNQNSILLKSEADITNLKDDFVRKKLNSYDESCVKPNCQVCRQNL